MKPRAFWLPVWLMLVLAIPAWADRVQVYSLQGMDCGDCEREIAPFLKQVKGVKKWSFDRDKFEFTMTLADHVTDDEVIAAIAREGCCTAVAGAGQAKKMSALPHEPYPEGTDMVVVTEKGDAVGSLDKLRVSGKYTVLDFYADWCGPCRLVDKQLREIVGAREDVAIRKLNIVSFDSPLARELGRKLKALPYVVVFDPNGKRTEITGNKPEKIAAAVGIKE